MDCLYELNDNIPTAFCQDIIQRFDLDTRTKPGMTLNGYVPQIKDTVDLMISELPDWKDVVSRLDVALRDGYKKYIQHLNTLFPIPIDDLLETCWHRGLQIQKSGIYTWHHDFSLDMRSGQYRIATFIWYLTDEDESSGTDFVYRNITPRAGKLVFFPSTWNMPHRGRKALHKYIITGWMYGH